MSRPKKIRRRLGTIDGDEGRVYDLDAIQDHIDQTVVDYDQAKHYEFFRNQILKLEFPELLIYERLIEATIERNKSTRFSWEEQVDAMTKGEFVKSTYEMSIIEQSNLLLAKMLDAVHAVMRVHIESVAQFDGNTLLPDLPHDVKALADREAAQTPSNSRLVKSGAKQKKGQKEWKGSLRDAGQEVIRLYDEDYKKPAAERQFKDPTDAGNKFYEQHTFVHKPNLTRKQFAENVKKAKHK